MMSASLHLVCSGYAALALKLYLNVIIIIALFAAVIVGCSYCVKCLLGTTYIISYYNIIGYTALYELYPVI